MGRKKKRVPTRAIRVYEDQAALVTQFAGQLGEDAADLLEPGLRQILSDLLPRVQEATNKATEQLAPAKAPKGKKP